MGKATGAGSAAVGMWDLVRLRCYKLWGKTKPEQAHVYPICSWDFLGGKFFHQFFFFVVDDFPQPHVVLGA